MENETNNTETNATGNKTGDAQQKNPQDVFGEIWKFLNNPVIANAGLGAVLMWAIDPKGLKASMESMVNQMNVMTEKINEQSDTIRSLKKQMKRMSRQLAGEDEDGQTDEKLNGYRKVDKRKSSVYLD